MKSWRWMVIVLAVLGCDGPGEVLDANVEEDGSIETCEVEVSLEVGDPEGHPEPLGSGPGEARAGRARAEDLPALPSRLEVWEPGDFILANDRVAMVIESARPSELYDPWGGRPVGVARVEDGRLVEPADFGEILILLGRMSPMTERVTVLADGSEGGAAIVRAEGWPRPIPFFETVTQGLLRDDYSRVRVAIDYVLEPGAEHVDIRLQMLEVEGEAIRPVTGMHAFMHTPRMPVFAPGVGFDVSGELPWAGFADEAGTSFSYTVPGRSLSGNLSVSGFVGFIGRGIAVPACAQTEHHYARIAIGGPGMDGAVAATLRTLEQEVRRVEGVVRDASGVPAPGVRVLLETAEGGGLWSRTLTDAEGRYALHGPADEALALRAFRRGDRVVGPRALESGEDEVDLALGEGGLIRVVARDADTATPLPVRVQLLPAPGTTAPSLDGRYGEPRIQGGRIQVDFAATGESELRAPAGEVRVVVSRGYEYELFSELVTVREGETVELDVDLPRVVDTTGVLCGDFHIHTHRSNDSGDDVWLKVRAAVADGVELPVRTEHEYVASFQSTIEELGLEAFAYGVSSVELTSFEAWGHMNVVPLEVQPDALNGGTPLWHTYPTPASPDTPLTLRTPPEVFADVRARPEAPVVIIAHPRGGANYFTYAGYDPETGSVDRPEAWDEAFGLVEVFNDSGWRRNLGGTVRDWLSFLRQGRRVFAVGSSDSHGVSSSPIGYPRTCLALGTDDPREVTPVALRDALAAGHSTVSGGVYVDTWVGEARPGDEAIGVGPRAEVRVRVQAASWVDVDAIDLVVDGEIVDTVNIEASDGDPLAPHIRFDRVFEVNVDPEGSFVLVAAYGDATLEPVHPGRIPFGVTNPIFLLR